MQDDLHGLRGIVTGAQGPLGREICRQLLSRGAAVIATDLPHPTPDFPPEMACGLYEFIPGDLLDSETIEQVIEGSRMGPIDFLVNNASFTGTSSLKGYAVPFTEQSDAAFEMSMRLNLLVPFSLCQRLAADLKASSHASIVNIASIYGLVAPDFTIYKNTAMGNPAAYAATKGGLIQLTRYLASALSPGVRVNAIAAGGIFRDQPQEFVNSYVERTLLNRMATEDDVAKSVAWLVSSASSYITGQVIAVDGGWTAK